MVVALPLIMLSEPASCPKTVLKEGVEISLWTKRWEVKKGNLALGQLLNHFKVTFRMKFVIFINFFAKNDYGLRMTAVCYGTKVLYSDLFDAHKKRIPQK